MKISVNLPPPTPPKTYTLTLSQEELDLLERIAYRARNSAGNAAEFTSACERLRSTLSDHDSGVFVPSQCFLGDSK